MSRKRSSVYNTMRGGQIVFHYVRMTAQVLSKNAMIFVIANIIAAAIMVTVFVNNKSVNLGVKYVFADIKTNYMFGKDDITTIALDDGRVIKTTWGRIYANDAMRGHYNDLKSAVIYCFFLSGVITVILLVAWFYYLSSRGKKEADDEFIRGGKLGDFADHEKLIKADEKESGVKSKLSIAGVKMPPKSDRTNIAFIGVPGVGKSVSLSDIFDQSRAMGDKNFILDPGGEFTRKFYREGKDIILSPKDARSHYWDVWSEGGTYESFHITANSLIAESAQEGGGRDFFAISARIVFETVAQKLYVSARQSGKPASLKKLSNYLLRVDDETLVDMVKNSDAKAILNENSEKTTASIRATLAAFIQPLARLKTNGTPFSFKDWVNNGDDSWVFVPITPTDRIYYRPVLTMWIEHFAMAVLSKPSTNFEGQTFNLSIDELPSYNKIPALPVFMAEARKNGGNTLLGFQNRSQVEAIYGTKSAQAIEGLVGTYCVFRATSNADSKWASELLMSADMDKSGESLSFGSASVRDAVNINKTIKEHRLVTAAEVINLKDLNFYFRFGKGYNVLLAKQKFVDRDDIATPIVTLVEEFPFEPDVIDSEEKEKAEKPKKEKKPKADPSNKQKAAQEKEHLDPPPYTTEYQGDYEDIPAGFEALASQMDAYAQYQNSEDSTDPESTNSIPDTSETPAKKDESTTPVQSTFKRGL